MHYLRSLVVFAMGFFLCNAMIVSYNRGYPTTLETIGFVLYPAVALLYAKMSKCND